MNRSKKIVMINAVLILAFILIQTVLRERMIGTSESVLFRLAPVDPRSLMQGDFMTLRYDISDYVNGGPRWGFLICTRDLHGVATPVRYQKKLQPLGDTEIAVRYHSKNGIYSIGNESFFFQEGTGDKYGRAEYGSLKVNSLGYSSLVGLCDAGYQIIQ